MVNGTTGTDERTRTTRCESKQVEDNLMEKWQCIEKRMNQTCVQLARIHNSGMTALREHCVLMLTIARTSCIPDTLLIALPCVLCRSMVERMSRMARNNIFCPCHRGN